MTDSTDALIDAHLGAWNAAPGPDRDQVIANVYAADVTIGEPGAALTGHDGMARAIAGVQAQAPGALITRSGPIQTAQEMVAYTWDLGFEGAPRLASGRDVLIIRDGVIHSLYVVLDTP